MNLNPAGKLIVFAISVAVYLVSVALFVLLLTQMQLVDIWLWMMLLASVMFLTIGSVKLLSLVFQRGWLSRILILIVCVLLPFFSMYLGVKWRFVYYHYLLSEVGKKAPCKLDKCEKRFDLSGEEYLSCSCYIEVNRTQQLSYLDLPKTFKPYSTQIECKYLPENSEIVEFYIEGKWQEQKFRISRK